MKSKLGTRVMLLGAGALACSGAFRAEAESRGEARGLLRPSLAGIYVSEEGKVPYAVIRQGEKADLLQCTMATEAKRTGDKEWVMEGKIPGAGASAEEVAQYIAAYCRKGMSSYALNEKRYFFGASGKATRVIFTYAGTHEFDDVDGHYKMVTDTGTLTLGLLGNGRDVPGWDALIVASVRVTNLPDGAPQISSSRLVAGPRVFGKIDYPAIRD